MIKIQSDIEDFEVKEKFSFTSFKRKFKITNSSSDNKLSSTKLNKTKKFSFKNLFRKDKKHPEVKFESGYGELNVS